MLSPKLLKKCESDLECHGLVVIGYELVCYLYRGTGERVLAKVSDPCHLYSLACSIIIGCKMILRSLDKLSQYVLAMEDQKMMFRAQS